MQKTTSIMKEAYFFKPLSLQQVQCRACYHYCVLSAGQRGKCGVRENQKGVLYSLVYGKPISIAIDPIEKKPLYHFLPHTQTLSLATFGCNFTCLACQNWEISQGPKISAMELNQSEVAPEKIIEMALQNHLPSISYTYTEPTVFVEYALDIMKMAKEKGLKNIWVSNGFFSPETFDAIAPFLDAANIDLKGFSEDFYQKVCGGRLSPVLENLKKLHQAKIWLEITTLVIPTLNDQDEVFEGIAHFIKKELDEQVPWHISRFSPEISWQLQYLTPTPLSTLKRAQQIGKKAGLKNIHLGNVFL